MNKVNIEEKQTVYNVEFSYHSDMKCENYDAKIVGIEEEDGRVTIKPGEHPLAVGFVFDHSDPDRVIAIAQMIKSFAEMIKQINKNPIDISDNS